MQVQFAEQELYLLEVIDALGGDVRVGELRSFISRTAILTKLSEIFWELRVHGLVRHYAIGRYALTAHGRAALKMPWDLAKAS